MRPALLVLAMLSLGACSRPAPSEAIAAAPASLPAAAVAAQRSARVQSAPAVVSAAGDASGATGQASLVLGQTSPAGVMRSSKYTLRAGVSGTR